MNNDTKPLVGDEISCVSDACDQSQQHVESNVESVNATETFATEPFTTNGGDEGWSTSGAMSSQALPIVDHKAVQRWVLLEPAVFLSFFGIHLSNIVFQNQLLYQTCLYVYHYNRTTCEPLLGVKRETPEVQLIEAEVQKYVAKILMVGSLLESSVPAVASLFIGPWSDKFGRRPILLLTFLAFVLKSLILLILVSIAGYTIISPWLFVLTSLPSALSGGTCALITVIYCYISDVTEGKSREFRMILMEASLSAGMMLSSELSGYLYAATNASIMFSISCTLTILAWLYVYIFIGESLHPQQIQTSQSIFRDFFRFELIIDLIRTCLKRRPNWDRTIIWLTISSLTLALFTMEGDSTITYLFVRRQFQWTLKDFATFSAARIVVQIMGMVIIKKLMRLSIISMLMISFGSCVLESIVRATAIYWYELYLGLGLGIMRGVLGPMGRAILSNVTPISEVGKIFALTTSLESLSPLISAPLYTVIYNSTLSFYPGLFNFVSAGFFLLCYILIATIYGIVHSMPDIESYAAIKN